VIRKILTAVLLVLLLLGLAFAYLFYRSGQSSSAEVIRYLETGAPIAATECPFSGGSFEGNKSGTIFIDGTLMRVDWEQTIQGTYRTAHAVSDDGKIFYTWNDQNDTAFFVPMQKFIDVFINLADTGGICRPWLSPDTSKFVVPYDVTFVAYNE